MTQINQNHLEFMKEAKQMFESNQNRTTYRDEAEQFIALRTGADNDCIEIFELGERVANFVQMIDKPTKDFAPVEFTAYVPNEIKVGDEVEITFDDGIKFSKTGIILNINEFRGPKMTYAIDAGIGDELFLGINNITKIKGDR